MRDSVSASQKAISSNRLNGDYVEVGLIEITTEEEPYDAIFRLQMLPIQV
jgi:hypothetical protein